MLVKRWASNILLFYLVIWEKGEQLAERYWTTAPGLLGQSHTHWRSRALDFNPNVGYRTLPEQQRLFKLRGTPVASNHNPFFPFQTMPMRGHPGMFSPAAQIRWALDYLKRRYADNRWEPYLRPIWLTELDGVFDEAPIDLLSPSPSDEARAALAWYERNVLTDPDGWPMIDLKLSFVDHATPALEDIQRKVQRILEEEGIVSKTRLEQIEGVQKVT